MKKILAVALGLFISSMAFSQVDSTAPTRKIIPPTLSSRSNDHLLIQIGYAGWGGKPDSFQTSGLPRAFNAYFMFDFPFKTSPSFSVAIGAGVATDNIYFTETSIGIKDLTPTLLFKDVSDTNHFKKYKLSTAWLEAPVELRYSFNPSEPGKSVKIAIGAKVGILVNAHTKGKTLQDKDDKTLIAYTQKENSKKFFNNNRLSLTGRIGYGHFSLFTNYQVTSLFKEGVAPQIKPFSVGLTISGL